MVRHFEQHKGQMRNRDTHKSDRAAKSSTRRGKDARPEQDNLLAKFNANPKPAGEIVTQARRIQVTQARTHKQKSKEYGHGENPNAGQGQAPKAPHSPGDVNSQGLGIAPRN